MSNKATKNVKMPFTGKITELSYVPKITFSKELRCGTCKKSQDELKSTLKSCDRCKIAFYCGKECQVKDFHLHKRACKHTVPPTLPKNDPKAYVGLSEKLAAALYRWEIAKSKESSDGLLKVQEELTDIILVGHYDRTHEIMEHVLSIKSIMYLYLDSYYEAYLMIQACAYNCNLISQLEEDETLTDPETGVNDMHESLKKACLKTDAERGSKTFKCDQKSAFSLVTKLVGNFPISWILKNAPIHLLVAILAFQYKWNQHSEIDQSIEYNVVLKAISRRNLELLNRLINPAPNFLVISSSRMPCAISKKSNNQQQWALTIMSYAWPLFNNIPGAREHILRFLYPGIEIVHLKG